MTDSVIHSLQITIGGQKYDIRTSSNKEDILRIAEDADKKVTELQKHRLTYQQALVLTLLDYAETADVNTAAAEEYRKKVGAYLKDAEDAKLECEALRRENERLKKKLIANN